MPAVPYASGAVHDVRQDARQCGGKKQESVQSVSCRERTVAPGRPGAKTHTPMKTYEHLIIGGGIAGVTAAETIRGRDAVAGIGIITAEPHMLYSRVLLPSYLKGKIRREQVFLRKAEDFVRQRIEYIAGRTTISINTADQRIILDGGEEIGYGKLLIAAGGNVRAWPAPGRVASHIGDRIFRLQTLDDADRLFEALPMIRRPIVVGSSFIALECIETFLLRGVAPRVLMRGPRLFDSMLDDTGAGIIEENMRQRGVVLMPDDEAESVTHEGTVATVVTKKGEMIDGDAVAVGVGIRRNTAFLEKSGIVHTARGVPTDTFLETNVSGIFAAGDIAEYFDARTGRHRTAGNWTSAMLQGRHAGLVMTGERTEFSSVPAYSIVNLGLNITAIGECILSGQDGEAETESRMSSVHSQYERFFMRDGVLVGAFLINRFQDKSLLADMIGRGMRIDRHRDRLRDPLFDIRELLAIMD